MARREVEAAYATALAEAKAALKRARGTKDSALWKKAHELAQKAVATGHTDDVAARVIATEAGRHLKPTIYTDWPFTAVDAKRRQEETAAVLGIPVETTLDLGQVNDDLFERYGAFVEISNLKSQLELFELLCGYYPEGSVLGMPHCPLSIPCEQARGMGVHNI